MNEFELVWYLNTYFQGEQHTLVKTILRKENGRYLPIPKAEAMHLYRGYGSWLRHCRPNQFKEAYNAHKGITLSQALKTIPKKEKLNRGDL